MKILYVSQYFPPETAAPASRVAELSRIWAHSGHQVTVLTGFPHHPTGQVPKEYRRKLYRLFMRDDRDGVSVRRSWLIPLPNRKSWERILTYASFCVSAACRGVFLGKPDVVIATSPQLLVGLAGLVIARFKRVPFVFEVRDLWPESLEAVGVSGRRSMLMRALGWVAGLLYRRSTHVVVVTHAFKEHLERHWGIPSTKISVVMNGVDHNLFAPKPPDSGIIQEFNLQGRFVVGYIGTMGNAHGPETLVTAAEILKHADSEVLFLVVGDGAEKEQFSRMVEQKGLDNVRIAPAQSRARVPDLISAVQVCLVLLKNSKLFQTVIPTKLLEFMACGRPVVLAAEGEAAGLVKSAGAGICSPPEDGPALAHAILDLKTNPARLRDCGIRGSDFIARTLTREQTAGTYVAVLNSVLGAAATNGPGIRPDESQAAPAAKGAAS
jgi:glycosyltransferase involved in cell wall biosynthesis